MAEQFMQNAELLQQISDLQQRIKELENAESVLKRAEHESAILAEIGCLINSTLDIEVVYERFTEKVRTLIDCDRISVDLHDAAQDTFTVAYVRGFDIPHRRPGDIIPLKGSLCEIILRTRTGLLIHPGSVEDVTTLYPCATNVSTVRAGMHSLISVPLISRDEVIGTLHLRAKKPDAFTKHDLLLAERIGVQIGGAIANARLFRELQRLQRTEKLEAIGRLAAGIAHDFNNLLGTVFGYLELSKEEAEKAQQHKIAQHLSKALDAFEEAERLTEQLLTFTKGGAPDRRTQSLPSLVRKAAAHSLSGSNVAPVYAIPSGIWACSVDEHQISQAMECMLSNARQAMPAGGVIELSVRNVCAGEVQETLLPMDYVRISIRDHGTGISAEHLPRIFDPFFSTKRMGAGLGLAICHSIIRQHEGFIEVESEVGRGTAFHVYLPAAPEQHPRMQETGSRHPAMQGEYSALP